MHVINQMKESKLEFPANHNALYLTVNAITVLPSRPFYVRKFQTTEYFATIGLNTFEN